MYKSYKIPDYDDDGVNFIIEINKVSFSKINIFLGDRLLSTKIIDKSKYTRFYSTGQIINSVLDNFNIDISCYKLDEFEILDDFLNIKLRKEDHAKLRDNKLDEILNFKD